MSTLAAGSSTSRRGIGLHGALVDIPNDIRQWRKALRTELLSRRMAIPSGRRRQWNLDVTRRLLDAFPMLEKMIVGFYRPFQGEFDPRLAIRRLRARGAIAALPVVAQKAFPLEFREWRPDVRMRSGLFNLREPEGSPTLAPQALLIPPVGFDVQGYRLGYGGGYFDRTLAILQPQPLKIGVAFEVSRIETIRPQSWDIPMDFIVTESGIHRAGPAGLEKLRDAGEAAAIAASMVNARSVPAAQLQGDALDALRTVAREYASPPCYAHELDPYYWD